MGLRPNCQTVSGDSNVTNMIFDKDDRGITGDLPSAVPVLWYGLLTAGPALLLWRRYKQHEHLSSST